MILCDIGNTTFHFLINGKEKKYFLNEKLPSFNQRVYYISVNDSGTKNLKSSNDDVIDLENYLEFKTKYKGMGVDRKIACIANKESIIVDAGSAITVDIMKKGKHKGGFILPGFKAIKDLYPNTSHKLQFDFNPKVNLDKIPLCTQDAISYAILKSIIQPIKNIRNKQQIIFTGGDGEFLSKYFKNSIYKKDLIFENMKRIIDANNCIA
ncbi:pantothenate kinase [Malaciobacter canalis]|uniref:Type III pantothenate kinase n=1 Tax=Malaciobacter canalis TaxID=1912871 RepID=A0ABX4LRW3_9BACT|nr:type III pantothenate kinase [Malaciobacter canalis]PHO10503.1 pantothenate kinase [Malaciobacter canalis]QEE31948.1 pantothenate kinase, type III [Malaciobacter canalis]